MSNILAMPLVELQVTTSNNEDWIDSILYLVQTGDPSPPQLDIRGIIFDMEIRRSALEHEVLLSASTDNTRLRLAHHRMSVICFSTSRSRRCSL